MDEWHDKCRDQNDARSTTNEGDRAHQRYKKWKNDVMKRMDKWHDKSHQGKTQIKAQIGKNQVNTNKKTAIEAMHAVQPMKATTLIKIKWV